MMPQPQQRKSQQPGQSPAPSPAQNPASPAMGQPPSPSGVPQGGAPRPASPMAPQLPQSNVRMGGVMGSPTVQAQPWAHATQQQATVQQQAPRSYYGESEPAQQPPKPDGMGMSELAGQSPYEMQAGWQQEAQIPEAPQPIQQQQSSAAPGMQAQRKPQQRSYYGEL